MKFETHLSDRGKTRTEKRKAVQRKLHLRQLLGSEVFCLLFVDVLHQNTFVLEDVSFHLEVESVVPGV